MQKNETISKNTTVEHKCLICVCSINEYGLKCSRCYRSTCRSCLKLILEKINKKDYDQWCHVVNTYINNTKIPYNFIGHCCEINHFSKGLLPIDVYFF